MAVLLLVVLLSSVARSEVRYSCSFVCECKLNWADFHRFMPHGVRLKPWVLWGAAGRQEQRMIDNYMHYLAYQMNQQPTPRYQRNIRCDDTLGREGSLSPDPYLQPRRLTHAASLLLRSRLLKPPKIPEHQSRSG